MNWMAAELGQAKPVIAMCHLLALPTDPGYDADGGMAKVVEAARADVQALQDGGVDAVMFSNEASLPYLLHTRPVTAAAMARVIGELLGELTVPFGVNVLWDPAASLDLAMATGARFVREIFTGVYASDFGLWNTNGGEVARHRRELGAQGVRLLYNIVPESAEYLARREVSDIARTTVFNCGPDALCVSGATAGSPTDASVLQAVRAAVPDTPLFANTGVRAETVAAQLEVADGVVTGTAFKRDGYIWNAVEEARVAEFMAQARRARGE